MITIIVKNDKKVYENQRLQEVDSKMRLRENRTIWRGGGDPIPVPSLMGKTEERAKSRSVNNLFITSAKIPEGKGSISPSSFYGQLPDC